MESEERLKYKRDFMKDNYKTVKLYLDKNYYPEIEEAAKKAGYKKVGTYIKDLVEKENQKMELTHEEELVINMMRYTTDTDKKEIIDKALEIDNKYTSEEKKNMFEIKMLKVKNNNGTINM